MNNASIESLKPLMIGAVGLLFAVVLGWIIGSEGYQPLVLGTLIIIGLIIWFGTGRFFWVLTIASSFLGGTFPILGGAFSPFQILMLMGVAKFVVEDVIMRRTSLMAKNRFDMLMIAGFMGILTFHGIHDRFGMRFLGSSVWGGHNYVNVYVGLMAFFVVQSIPMKPKVWSKLPYVILAVTTFDLFIAVITTIFPASIYKIYPFYSAISVTGLEDISRTPDVTQRIGSFGNFGFILIIIVLASISLQEILNPKNLRRLILLILGSITVLFSGFRSAVVNAAIAFLAAGIRDLKYGVLALLPLFVGILFAFSVIHAQFFHLPKQFQRSLVFIPGSWDAEMVQDAAASNDFRWQIWSLWTKEYFPEHALLGRGFGFKSDWSKQSTTYQGAIDYRQTVEVGNIHNGLFSTLDTFGIVGTIFFVIWNLRVLARTFRVSFRRRDAAAIALRFLALFLSVSIISYWYGAQNVGTFLPQEFALVAVFLRLQHAIESESIRSRPAAAELQQGVREELARA
jgi:hypothetical protein